MVLSLLRKAHERAILVSVTRRKRTITVWSKNQYRHTRSVGQVYDWLVELIAEAEKK